MERVEIFESGIAKTPSLVNMRNTIINAMKLEHDLQNNDWIRINDDDIAESIVRKYSDPIERKILNSCVPSPMTIMEILKIIGIPQTTAYRKILTMINEGFLIPYYITSNRKTTRYVSTIKRVRMEMLENGSFIVFAIFTSLSLLSS